MYQANKAEHTAIEQQLAELKQQQLSFEEIEKFFSCLTMPKIDLKMFEYVGKSKDDDRFPSFEKIHGNDRNLRLRIQGRRICRISM